MSVSFSIYIFPTTDKCYFIKHQGLFLVTLSLQSPPTICPVLYISTGLSTTSNANFCCPLLQLSPSELHGGLKQPFQALLPPFPPDTLENYTGLKLTKNQGSVQQMELWNSVSSVLCSVDNHTSQTLCSSSQTVFNVHLQCVPSNLLLCGENCDQNLSVQIRKMALNLLPCQRSPGTQKSCYLPESTVWGKGLQECTAGRRRRSVFRGECQCLSYRTACSSFRSSSHLKVPPHLPGKAATKDLG